MNLIDLLNQLALSGGDWVIYLLLLTSLVSVYVMAERTLYFYIISGHAQQISKLLAEHLDKGEVDTLCQELKKLHCPEARILCVGLSAFGRGAANVHERMESQLIKEKTAMETNLTFLATAGSNAPFVGLFGTVLGVIKAFHELSLQGSGGGTMVMSGISQALIATAVGIMVAIPALVAYNYFKSRAKDILASAESLDHLAMSYLKPDEKR